MNTQNILNSQEVKDFIEKQKSRAILHDLGVPPDNSTYSVEAQLLEDPWKIKEEMKAAQARMGEYCPEGARCYIDCGGRCRARVWKNTVGTGKPKKPEEMARCGRRMAATFDESGRLLYFKEGLCSQHWDKVHCEETGKLPHDLGFFDEEFDLETRWSVGPAKGKKIFH